MKILHRYVTSGFLVTFLATLFVFTFVMAIGALFKANELLVRGVAWVDILRVFLWRLPSLLSFSIPVSVMTSSLLVFGRLSADSETSAMKASGISAWQIVLGPLTVAAALSVVCLFINNQLMPRSNQATRQIIVKLGAERPADLFDEGRFIDEFPGLTIYIGSKKGERLENVRIFDLRTPGVKREIRARSGMIAPGRAAGDVTLQLFDVRVDPFADDRPGAMYAKKWSLSIENAMKGHEYRKRRKDSSFSELLGVVRDTKKFFPGLDDKDRAVERMRTLVEIHKRIALSVCCFSFVLLGFPLGTRGHRRESSVGVGIGLLLVFNFYIFIIIAEELAKRPGLRPDFICWIPVALSVGIGAWMIRRME
jgi:lipopolysaccharide export system permease protein